MKPESDLCPMIFCALRKGHPGQCCTLDEPCSEEQKPFLLFPDEHTTAPWRQGQLLPHVPLETSYTGSCARCSASFTFEPSETQVQEHINRAKIPCPFCGTWHDGYLVNQASFVLAIEAEEDPAYCSTECEPCRNL